MYKSVCDPDLPVRVIGACANHLHGPLPYATGADVPPQPQVQDQPQGAGQRAGEHHTNLGQPGQTWRQLEAITGAHDVRDQLGQEEDEEATGEDCGEDRAQRPVQEHTQRRVSQGAQEEQGTRLGRREGGRDASRSRKVPSSSSSSSCFHSLQLTRKFPLLLIGSRRLAARFSSSEPQLWST